MHLPRRSLWKVNAIAKLITGWLKVFFVFCFFDYDYTAIADGALGYLGKPMSSSDDYFQTTPLLLHGVKKCKRPKH